MTGEGCHGDFHVLVVEDETVAARQIARFLERSDMRATTAGNGAEALDLHRRDPADAIVTDLRMPGGDGLELIREVRDGDARLPIIVMTGQVLRDAETEAVEAGATRVLRKPIDIAALADLLSGFRRLPSAV